MGVEQIMEQICDNCHWPYVETDQQAMEDRCAACQIETQLRQLESKEERPWAKN